MRKQLLVLCPLLLFASAVWAAPTCVNGSLLSFETLGGAGCTLGGLTFSNFTFSTAGSVVPLPAAGDVTVQTINSGTNAGLSFVGPFAAAAGMSLDALIGFTISGATIAGDTLAMQGFGASPGGAVTVAESLCEGIINGSGTCSGAVKSLSVFDNASGIKASDTTALDPGVTTLSVMKDIIVQGGSTSAPNAAGVSVVINTVPMGGGGLPGGGQTPEPGSLLMLGSGLVMTAMLLRKRLRRS